MIDKVGRDEAERDYHGKLVPAITVRCPPSRIAHALLTQAPQGRPDLFPADKLSQYFSLERYHLMGSRILSRSFTVEQWKGEHPEGEDEHDGDDEAADTSAMDVDPQEAPSADAAEPTEPAPVDGSDGPEELHVEADGEDSDDEDHEDPSDVAMVPMADMLNARFESENVSLRSTVCVPRILICSSQAKLFYEERELKMVSTKPIKAGEQIVSPALLVLPRARCMLRFVVEYLR